MTRLGGAKQACLATSHSRPSPRSPCSRCARLGPMACRRAWRWLIRRMATTASFELGSRNSRCLTRLASCPARWSGGPAKRRCRRRADRAAAGAPPGCAATRRICRSRSRRWPRSLPPMPGSRSPRPSPGQAWREGSNTVLTSRFARLRVRPAHGEAKRSKPADEEWLLIEWPEGEAEPDHYWLSTLPADISFECLVDQTKLRWRIERDYLELKQEVGLDHYEGRGWRGFHHHASLCIAAYGFLISETETIPPSGHPRAWCRPRSAVPDGYRPRGAAAAHAAPCAELHRHPAYPPRTHPGACTASVSMLRANAAAIGQAD